MVGDVWVGLKESKVRKEDPYRFILRVLKTRAMTWSEVMGLAVGQALSLRDLESARLALRKAGTIRSVNRRWEMTPQETTDA